VDTNGYYALLAPLFLAAMLVEAGIAWRRGRRVYRLDDTLANLSCGAGQILCGLFTAGFLLAAYDGFQRRFALVTWPAGSKLPYLLAFIGVDFCYYWFHRASHAVPLLWAFHAPHHQSREMNISVALRQPFLSDLTALLFFWPLPLLGIPEGAFFLAVGGLSLYEALMHTTIFDGSRLWGQVFNTPAFHRLHHATNDGYRDRNFASTTVIWDRLFGTAVREHEPPRYGTLPELGSHDPIWAQLAPFVALFRPTAPRARPGGRRAPAVALFAGSMALGVVALATGQPALVPVVLAGLAVMGALLDGRLRA
jgi:sterol desaturase/sphingolipid hydroxylase (fatty acid hydroxylase superfamily)